MCIGERKFVQQGVTWLRPCYPGTEVHHQESERKRRGTTSCTCGEVRDHEKGMDSMRSFGVIRVLFVEVIRGHSESFGVIREFGPQNGPQGVGRCCTMFCNEFCLFYTLGGVFGGSLNICRANPL